MKIMDHQLIGATVEYEENRYTCTGAIREHGETKFRLLDPCTGVEKWTEFRPRFGDIFFNEFRNNRTIVA